jgi:hypothetical protein
MRSAGLGELVPGVSFWHRGRSERELGWTGEEAGRGSRRSTREELEASIEARLGVRACAWCFAECVSGRKIPISPPPPSIAFSLTNELSREPDVLSRLGTRRTDSLDARSSPRDLLLHPDRPRDSGSLPLSQGLVAPVQPASLARDRWPEASAERRVRSLPGEQGEDRREWPCCCGSGRHGVLCDRRCQTRSCQVALLSRQARPPRYIRPTAGEQVVPAAGE